MKCERCKIEVDDVIMVELLDKTQDYNVCGKCYADLARRLAGIMTDLDVIKHLRTADCLQEWKNNVNFQKN